MVRLSKKTDYAIQFLLALHDAKDAPLSLGCFARESHISFLFLQHIVRSLKSHELVTVTKGREGGYMLAKPLSEITVKEISDLLEGAPSVVPCIMAPTLCGLSGKCGARKRFITVNEKINTVLASITLADLL